MYSKAPSMSCWYGDMSMSRGARVDCMGCVEGEGAWPRGGDCISSRFIGRHPIFGSLIQYLCSSPSPQFLSPHSTRLTHRMAASHPTPSFSKLVIYTGNIMKTGIATLVNSSVNKSNIEVLWSIHSLFPLLPSHLEEWTKWHLASRIVSYHFVSQKLVTAIKDTLRNSLTHDNSSFHYDTDTELLKIPDVSYKSHILSEDRKDVDITGIPILFDRHVCWGTFHISDWIDVLLAQSSYCLKIARCTIAKLILSQNLTFVSKSPSQTFLSSSPHRQHSSPIIRWPIHCAYQESLRRWLYRHLYSLVWRCVIRRGWRRWTKGGVDKNGGHGESVEGMFCGFTRIWLKWFFVS